MKAVYVTVVCDALGEGHAPTKVLSGLRRVLKQRGHQRLHGSILRTVASRLTASQASRTIARVARLADVDTYQAVINKELVTLAGGREPKVIIDETLIGGYQLEANSQRLDASYKTALHKLYRNIIQ